MRNGATVNLGPVQVAWRETKDCRLLATDRGALPVYKDEVVIIIVAKSVEEARRLLGDK